MNIITIIQAALVALNSSAELFLLEESRADNEELEHTGDTVVVFPDWKTSTNINQGGELVKTRRYNIIFKTPDEWDNSDNNESKSYDGETTIERIEAMETLADSVFSYISINPSQNSLFDAIREPLRWEYSEPIIRANNGTMSGVKARLTVIFRGDVVCVFNI